MQRLSAAALTLAAIGLSVPVLAADAAPAASPVPPPATAATPAPARPAPTVPTGPATPPKGVTNGKAGDVIFFEDFAGPTIDRSRWNVNVTAATIPNNEQETYIDSPDVLSIVTGAQADGVANALQIKPIFREGYTNPAGRKADFVSGRMDSRGKVEFLYGTIAARIKLSEGKGLWPAFWSMGNTGSWPANGEMDILENAGDASWSTFAMHGPGYSGNTPIVHRVTYPADNDTTKWHVYSVDWTKDAMVFRVDGEEKYRVTKTDIEKYGPWAYDNSKYILVNLALGGAYPQGLNKTQNAPYPGLPTETVDQIKAGKGRMLVDWIKVTKLE